MECVYLHPFTEMEKEKQTGNFLKHWLIDGIQPTIKSTQPLRPSVLPRRLLNVSSISSDLGHTRATVERYLSLLERLFLIRRLAAWHRNSAKRLVKAPKIHFCDSGLVTVLAGLKPEQWIQQQSQFGHVLESFVLQQLIAQSGWLEEPVIFGIIGIKIKWR